LKILQINASYKPAYVYGGPTRSVSKLSEELKKAGCDITVFTTTANGRHELPVAISPILVDDVPVYYFKRLTKDHSHFSPTLLFAVWKQVKKFDAVHIHAWWNTVSVLSCFIALVRGVPVIISPRGTLSVYSFQNKNIFYKKRIHYLLGRRLLKSSYIHVTSAHEKTRLIKLITPKKIFVIPNFVQLPGNYPAKHNEQSDKLKLLFLSRIEEKKGLDILLHALPRITVPYHLTIAGDGESSYINHLKGIAVSNGTANHLSWIGFQDSNKFEVLDDHDLLILPSHDENFGNVVIESLSVGTAVLISDRVGLANYVTGNNLGWLCRTQPTSVADCINRVTFAQLAAIKEKAPAIIAHDFNESNLVNEYVTMYQQII
jgi:glycosyltransferase involved in cell wall biosynthesis